MVEPSEPGIRPCLKCGWLFVSQDILRILRCADCKKGEDDYQPRCARLTQIEGSTGITYRDPTP